MTIFSPDGKYAYVCSSFTPETEVITVADHKIVGKVPQASPFCPNIAATPDSKQVWFTLKDIGKTQVFEGQPPFALLKTLETSPIGQAPQALVYVPDAVPAVGGTQNAAMTTMIVVPEGLGTNNLQPLGIAGQSAELRLASPGAKQGDNTPTSVSLSDQGLTQM